MNKSTFRVVLDIEYVPNGASTDSIRHALDQAVADFIEKGNLTGDTAAKVKNYHSFIDLDLSEIRTAKVGTAEHETFIGVLDELADSLEGGELRSDYSGRGMFGRLCYGITCDNQTEALERIAQLNLPRPTTDNMGLGYIVYWPGIEGKGGND